MLVLALVRWPWPLAPTISVQNMGPGFRAVNDQSQVDHGDFSGPAYSWSQPSAASYAACR